MSGESFNGVYIGRKLEVFDALFDVPMSNYQRDSIDYLETKDIKEFDKNKIITQTKLNKLIDKYQNDLERWHCKNCKYAMYSYRLGVSHFGKFKPVYKKLPKPSYRAKSTEKVSGYVYGDCNGKSLSCVYKTETLAKKAAMESLQKDYSKDPLFVFKCYQSKSYGHFTKRLRYGYVTLEEIGKMKSMPKKKPKSFMVIPVYYYLWDATVSDPEYEWM